MVLKIYQHGEASSFWDIHISNVESAYIRIQQGYDLGQIWTIRIFYVIATLETYLAGSYDVISEKSYDFEKMFKFHIQRSYVHNQLVTQSKYQYMFCKNVLTWSTKMLHCIKYARIGVFTDPHSPV